LIIALFTPELILTIAIIIKQDDRIMTKTKPV